MVTPLVVLSRNVRLLLLDATGVVNDDDVINEIDILPGLVETNETSDVDNPACLRWVQASRCHQLC